MYYLNPGTKGLGPYSHFKFTKALCTEPSFAFALAIIRKCACWLINAYAKQISESGTKRRRNVSQVTLTFQLQQQI